MERFFIWFKTNLFIVLISIVFSISLFAKASTNFIYDEEETYTYLIAFACLFTVFCIQCLITPLPSPFKFKTLDLFILVFAVLLMIPFFKGSWSIPEEYVITCSAILFYIFLRFSIHGNNIRLFLFLISFSYFIELALVVEQIVTLGGIGDYMKIKGSFSNPNLLCGFVISISPIVFYFILQQNIKWIVYAGIAFIVLADLSVIIISHSRSSLICILCSLIVFVCIHPKWNWLFIAWRKWIFLLVVICAGVVIAIGSFAYKKDSSLGRVLVWKVSLNRALESSIIGIGYNRFPIEYPQWQANYFSKDSGTADDKRVADVTYTAFNEYLQFLIEIGVFGLVLLLVMIIVFFRIKAKEGFRIELIALKICALNILILGLVSYPFRTIPFLILLLIVFSMSATMSSERSKIVLNKSLLASRVLICLLAGCLIYSSYFITRKYLAAKLWFSNRQSAAEFDDGAILGYDYLLNEFRYCGPFLFEYGQLLFQAKDYKRAANILNISLKYIVKEKTFYYLGQSYEQLGELEKAEHNYIYVSQMLPNRFEPRFLLSQLYLKQGKIQQAKQVALEIINMPIKIKSDRVSEIRSQSNYLLSNY